MDSAFLIANLTFRLSDPVAALLSDLQLLFRKLPVFNLFDGQTASPNSHVVGLKDWRENPRSTAVSRSG